jgi:hypothetical protein
MELLIETRSNKFIVKSSRLRNACHNGYHNVLNVKPQMVNYCFKSNISIPKIMEKKLIFQLQELPKTLRFLTFYYTDCWTWPQF